MEDHKILFEELPVHLLVEILSCGRLSAADLASLESSCRIFRNNDGLQFPRCFSSLVEFVASRLCLANSTFRSLSIGLRSELFDRCDGKWKLVLRYLQSVEQAWGFVETPSGKYQVVTGRYHTLLVEDSCIYSCGSSLCGVLGHGPSTQQCVFSRINYPFKSNVIHISASHNHAAFVTQSGEVFTCGDNPSSCSGHGEANRAIFRPRVVEALRGIPCKQVATGLSYTVILTTEGQVYTCGNNSHGQLGHGDTLDRPIPTEVEFFKGLPSVTQIAAGTSYTLVVTEDGSLYSFGYGSNFCLGHGEQHNELQPRVIQSLRRRNIHVSHVSAGDEHVVAMDSNGYVYTWGKGYCGALGLGDENDKTSPELLMSLQDVRAVQVCARKRKTFVLADDGSLYGFGWMGFGSLGFSERGSSDKVLKPHVLNSMKGMQIAQVSTALYHTVVITKASGIWGFGDNERGQLGLDNTHRSCPEPTQIALCMMDGTNPVTWA